MPEPIKADILPVPPREEAAKPVQRPQLKTVESAVPPPYGAGFEMLSETLAKAQDIARETALQLTETRLHQAQSLIALQETLLEMAHSNMAASFAAAQKILASTTLEDALAEHRRFAQGQVAALTEQASTLRGVASKMTGETAEPWAEYWTKSFARIRKTFGA